MGRHPEEILAPVQGRKMQALTVTVITVNVMRPKPSQRTPPPIPGKGSANSAATPLPISIGTNNIAAINASWIFTRHSTAAPGLTRRNIGKEKEGGKDKGNFTIFTLINAGNTYLPVNTPAKAGA